mgnify:CR=1 FL=1
MAKTRTITATFPTGEEVTRTTARTYTHCVYIYAINEQGKKTNLRLNWCGRPDLMEKAVAKGNKFTGYGKVTVKVAKVTNDPWAN